MKYTLLAMIVACVVIFIASGCSVYYPTSYRAFIPKQWDSEYNEYKRLCRENIGKVVYARPITKEEREEMDRVLEKHINSWLYRWDYNRVSKDIIEVRYTLYTKKRDKNIRTNRDFIAYQQIIKYVFNRHWTEFVFLHKGDPVFEMYYEASLPHLSGLFEQTKNNQQSIGTKDDILLTDTVPPYRFIFEEEYK